ncbi:MAG TPA: ABC transporter substrate-binding protein [Chloroflexota bacterium]|nr:ABC transporter substrate-binding protein [Chloroflexota bacterium]
MLRHHARGSGFAFLIELAVAALLAACAAPPRASAPGSVAPPAPAASTALATPAPLDVIIASPAQSLNFLVIDVALAHGFFAREGLNVQHVTMRSDTAIAALIAGEIDMTTSTGSLARAIPTGVPAKVLLYMVAAPNHSLYVHPSIRSVRDLVGQPFGIESPVSDVRVIAEAVLRGHGVDPATVSFRAIGSERLAALFSGAIMGTMLAPPEDVIAEREGFVRLARGRDYISMPMAGLGASVRYTQEEREKVRRVFRATLAALAFVRDNPPATIEFIASRFNMDREQAERAYEAMVWTRDGEVSPESVKGVLEFIERTGNLGRSVSPDEIVDYTLLREVRAALER